MELLLEGHVSSPAETATQLIAEFGSLGAVVAAPEAAIERVVADASGSRVTAMTALLRAALSDILRGDCDSGAPLSDSAALERYLKGVLAHQGREEFRVLYLNSKNALIRDEVASMGTVNATTVYPREIIRRALELNATALILAHNHPSGEIEPSREDVSVTNRICNAAAALDIVVHDHLIVSRQGVTSLRARGLMGLSKPVNIEADYNLSILARRLYAARIDIERHFAAELFADPVRDILLELFADGEDGRETDVSMSCISARVPTSTALRWLSEMANRNLVVRTPHPSDRRRWIVRLTPETHEAMRAYLMSVAGRLSGPMRRAASS